MKNGQASAQSLKQGCADPIHHSQETVLRQEGLEGDWGPADYARFIGVIFLSLSLITYVSNLFEEAATLS